MKKNLFDLVLRSWLNGKVSARKYQSRTRPAADIVEPLEDRALLAGGGYTLTFLAANPMNYAAVAPAPVGNQAPVTVGRVTAANGGDPIVGADYSTGLTSLAPGQMSLGQILAFETLIKVASNAPSNGSIQIQESFDTVTTAGSLFGYNGENYGYPGSQAPFKIYSAFVDATDSSAKIDTNASVTYTSTVVNHQIIGTFNVTGLDPNEQVVLEVWVVLDKLSGTPGVTPTGNVQTRLMSASTLGANGAVTGAISTGSQTTSINKVAQFFTSPSSTNDTYSTNEDTPLSVSTKLTGVLGNDTDPSTGDSTPLSVGTVIGANNVITTVNSVTGATILTAHGSVLVYSNGTFTYTPAANYSGTDSFKYTATNGTASTSQTTVTITINSTNDPPVLIQPTDKTTAEGSSITANLSATDSDSSTLTYSIVSVGGGAVPSWMSINSSTGQLTATPPDGPLSFSVVVQVSDGSLTNSKTFTLNVTNVAPTVNAGNHITLQIGDIFTRPSVDFTDPGTDTWTATVIYYDTDETTILAQESLTSSSPMTFGQISYHYDTTGRYLVVVTVTDEDGGIGTDYFYVNVIGKNKNVP